MFLKQSFSSAKLSSKDTFPRICMMKEFQHLYIIAGVVDLVFGSVSLQVWKAGFFSKMQIPLIKQKLFLCCTLMYLINSQKLNKSRCLLVFYVTVLQQLINKFCFVRAAFCSDVSSSVVIFSWVSAAFHCRWSCITHKTNHKTLLHLSSVVKGSKSRWRKCFDICHLPDRIVAKARLRTRVNGSSLKESGRAGSRSCSANITKSAFPARKQKGIVKRPLTEKRLCYWESWKSLQITGCRTLCHCKTTVSFPSLPFG